MKKYNIYFIKDWYGENKRKKQKYLAIHIKTKEQHTVLAKFMPGLDNWEDGYFWYLQSGGHNLNESPYQWPDYLMIEFNDIIFENEYEIY